MNETGLVHQLAHANDRTRVAVGDFIAAYQVLEEARKALDALRDAGLHLAAVLDAEDPEIADSIIDAVCNRCSPGIIGRRVVITTN